MANGKKYTRKDKKKAKKAAKIESGKYATSRERAERKGKRRGTGETDYSESAIGAAVKDAAHRVAYKTGLTKKRYRTKKVAPGNVGEPREKKTYTRAPKKPEMEKVEVQAAKFQSKKGEVARSKTYAAKTEEGLESATKKATAEISTEAPKSKSDVGKKEFAKNKAAQEAYEARKKRRKEKKESEKYEKGSRTAATRERQEKNVAEYKKKGARRTYKRRKKEYIQKAKSAY